MSASLSLWAARRLASQQWRSSANQTLLWTWKSSTWQLSNYRQADSRCVSLTTERKAVFMEIWHAGMNQTWLLAAQVKLQGVYVFTADWDQKRCIIFLKVCSRFSTKIKSCWCWLEFGLNPVFVFLSLCDSSFIKSDWEYNSSFHPLLLCEHQQINCR